MAKSQYEYLTGFTDVPGISPLSEEIPEKPEEEYQELAPESIYGPLITARDPVTGELDLDKSGRPWQYRKPVLPASGLDVSGIRSEAFIPKAPPDRHWADRGQPLRKSTGLSSTGLGGRSVSGPLYRGSVDQIGYNRRVPRPEAPGLITFQAPEFDMPTYDEDWKRRERAETQKQLAPMKARLLAGVREARRGNYVNPNVRALMIRQSLAGYGGEALPAAYREASREGREATHYEFETERNKALREYNIAAAEEASRVQTENQKALLLFENAWNEYINQPGFYKTYPESESLSVI